MRDHLKEPAIASDAGPATDHLDGEHQFNFQE